MQLVVKATSGGPLTNKELVKILEGSPASLVIVSLPSILSGSRVRRNAAKVTGSFGAIVVYPDDTMAPPTSTTAQVLCEDMPPEADQYPEKLVQLSARGPNGRTTGCEAAWCQLDGQPCIVIYPLPQV
ncbi:MAG: hypothetical protein R3313_00535 [Candidatus Saccharimonadales bacterium]|nr:hypothetical protein [Candidatus Saccharimonadales bacterium]